MQSSEAAHDRVARELLMVQDGEDKQYLGGGNTVIPASVTFETLKSPLMQTAERATTVAKWQSLLFQSWKVECGLLLLLKSRHFVRS